MAKANKPVATTEVANITIIPTRVMMKPKTNTVSAIYKEVKPMANNGNSIVNSVNTTFGMEPTQDLINCFKRMVAHLLFASENPKAYAYDLNEHYKKLISGDDATYEFKNWFCSGVSVRDEGAAIQGGYFKKNGQVINCNVPLVRYEQESLYPYTADLQAAINDINDEFSKFVLGKFVAPAQLTADFSPKVEQEQEQAA